MKKVGIITMYHDSINYGGILQAYALQKYIETKFKVDVKQIDYQKTKILSNGNSFKKRLKENGLMFTIKWGFDRVTKKINSKISKFLISKEEQESFINRKEKFKLFRDNIPHTSLVTNENITDLNNQFDIFVCGSDQIWKPGVCSSAYTLSFVNKNKRKLSYAASISKSDISKEDLDNLYQSIKDFDAISLREKSDVELINEKYDVDSKWVVDPTLLLDKKEWDKIIDKPLVKEKYIFCYLLESNRKRYRKIIKFAKTHNLKIAIIPFAYGTLNTIDRRFGDYKIYDAGPSEFLNLIKYASLVITDSFHGTVFSNIYNKKFYVLEREEEKTMNIRIKSLLEVFNQNERFINDKKLLSINELKDYNNKSDYYKKILQRSEEYLKNNIK